MKAPSPFRRWVRSDDCKSASRVAAYGEVIVTIPLHLVLHLNILSNDFIRYIAAACYEVAASPKMSPPKLPCQFLVFAQQLAGGLSLEPLEEFRHRDMGRYRQEEMQVVFGNMALDDLNIHCLANLPYQVPYSDRYFLMKKGLAVFGDPYHTKLDVIDSVRSLAVVFHNTASPLKSSPKGEGFSPIPRWGH